MTARNRDNWVRDRPEARGEGGEAVEDSVPDPPPFPRCPKCGVYLIVGFVTGSYVADLKAKHGWTIGRFDRDAPRARWDAAVTGNAVHRCPRCRTNLTA